MAIVKGAAGVPLATDQTLGYGTTTSVLVREVGRSVFYLDPNASPFTLLTDKAGRKTAVNPKFEWYEESFRAKETQVNNGGGYTDGATTLTVDDGTVFQVNDIVLIPRIDEKVRVTAQTSTTVTIVRAVGGSTAAALLDNDDLFVIGSSWAEGADVGIPDETQPVHKYNLTQIFRRPFGASRTREGAESYTGGNRSLQRGKKAVEHARNIERAFLFGGREEEGTGPDTLRRQTGGFTYFATENILDLLGSSLSEPDLEGWFEDVFLHTSSGDSRTLFASAPVISAFDMLGIDKIRLVPSDKTYGIAVGEYQSTHGRVLIVKHRLLMNGAGGTGHGDEAFAVDTKMLTNRTYTNGATKLQTNRQANGVDGWIDEYLTECGFQLTNPEVHGKLINVGAVT
jgi:hypothetical protein